MIIIIPGMSAPICYCGGRMEIYIDLYARRLYLKCPNCGLEQHEHIPISAGPLTLRAIYDAAHSLME